MPDQPVTDEMRAELHRLRMLVIATAQGPNEHGEVTFPASADMSRFRELGRIVGRHDHPDLWARLIDPEPGWRGVLRSIADGLRGDGRRGRGGLRQ